MRRRFGTALLAIAACALGACSDGARARGPSILLVTLDTTRADHLGSYGYRFGATPFLDQLGEQGVVFEVVYAPMPQTLPSHATMMTGLEPRVHGAVENARELSAEHETLAEVLGARGWDTAAFIGALVLDVPTGIAQGFDHFDGPSGERRAGLLTAERRADAVTDHVLAWARRRASDGARGPAFVWAHYYDPHGPYDPPPHKTRPLPGRRIAEHVRDQPQFARTSELPVDLATIGQLWLAYASELAFTDAEVARLVGTLRADGLLGELVVVVAGDHGEGLFEHDVKAHGIVVYEEQMLVPLLVHGADGVAPGTRVAQALPLARLMPTVLEIATGEVREGGLWTSLRAGRAPRVEPIFVERPHYDPGTARLRGLGDDWEGVFAGVLVDRFKYLRTPQGSALYDLREDPDELVDATARFPDEAARMAALLDQWIAAHPVEEVGIDGLSAARREVLEALGYLGGEAER